MKTKSKVDDLLKLLAITEDCPVIYDDPDNDIYMINGHLVSKEEYDQITDKVANYLWSCIGTKQVYEALENGVNLKAVINGEVITQ